MWPEDKISIYRDISGMLRLKIEGKDEEYPVKPIRCFPLTGADNCIGLFKIDPDGAINEEITLISELKNLDENSRKLIEEELNKTCFLNQITKIHSIKQAVDVLKWYVYTDKGERRFEVEGQRDICVIQPNLTVIKDSEGNRYQINSEKLDPKSLTLLEIYT